ncbi:NAD(P)-dependent alcohol dehydrogenase [Psychrobacillus psychrodurans]|uniref:NAD(P)-dependent alcohol dehydrogenase n=1 Tax=Psychrobacillus psychrodurans TaxID=126157 RepID=A0A9X3R976_9BACI|nr:NAD(P)-dependent alcohol dehydrogenase [Psychrobacillus psychrodurans]MCZ8532636.1 NAD(P)-dependent alcohol dehydrogenase [Psychrobacillus psychrodurans]
MKAIISNKYGSPDILEFKEVKNPIPDENQVLIKIYAASLNYGNLVLLKGEPFLARFAFGLFKPKYIIPGGDISGKVESVGKNVKHFKPGDEVFGDLSGCGWGGFAEYATVPENSLVMKPSNISYEEAAAVPMAATTALQSLRDKGKIKSGQKVLINGASGGVGTFAVQIAKSFGAEVTAVCSTRNLDIIKSIGADNVIDYTKENFTKNNELYDIILAVNGYQPISAYKGSLNQNGKYVMVGGSGAQLTQAMILGPLLSMTGSKKLGSFLQRPNQTDLIFIRDLIEAGQLKPIIDKYYKMSEVPNAFRYFEEGHTQGKIVITM